MCSGLDKSALLAVALLTAVLPLAAQETPPAKAPAIAITHVTLIDGTDAAAPNIYPGFSLPEELEMLVKEVGLSPMEAIQSATLEPARMMGLEKDLGTIAPGKLADLVLLDANPLQDIRNTKQIATVMTGGKLFDKEALTRMLNEAASAAAKE